MAYTPATKLPDIQIIELDGQSFASSLNSTSTTIYFSKSIFDYADAVVEKAMIIKGLNKTGGTENIYIPPNGLSADGKTATNVVRGIRLDGLDYTTGDPSLAKEFDSGDKIVCPVNAVLHTILWNVIRGTVASGGNSLIIGDETNTNPEIKWAKDGEVTGFLRLNQATNEVEFKDFGGSWTSINDSSVGNLLKVSNNDTTPGYLEDKQIAGANITKTILNEGGNEVIQWSASSQREGIVEHETYTPASWTGGGSPETNVALINDITDGSLRFNSDGVLYNIDGISFVGDITKADVASTLQDAINAVIPNTVTVDWSGTPIVITGSDTSVNSEVSGFTTSTGTVGTDLTTGTWLDLAAGSQTEKVLDPSADAGKVLLLKSDGGLSAKAVTGQDQVSEDQFLAIDASGGLKTVTLQTTDILTIDTDVINMPGSSSTYDALSFTVPANTLSEKDILVDMRDVDCDSVNISIFLGSELLFQENASSTTNQAYFVPIRLSLDGGDDQKPILLSYPDVSGYTSPTVLTPTVDTTVDQTFRIQIQGRSSNTGFRSEGAIVYTIPKSI